MRPLAFCLPLFAVFALPAAAQSQAVSPAPSDAVEFVRTCYTFHYKDQGFGTQGLVERKAWFAPQLYALLVEDAKRDPDSEDPPRLAFDPFTKAQEEADRLRLVKLDDQWRIENIVYSRRFNLVRILSTPG